MGATMAGYWLADWADELGVATADDVDRVFQDRVFVTESLKRAVEPARSDVSEPIAGDRSIVAGASLDLSGTVTCNHEACLRSQVDDLFGRVWHYFDQIVVTGINPKSVDFKEKKGAVRKASSLSGLEWISPHVKTLLYIRSAGAEDMLIFRPKTHACAVHLPALAEMSGLDRLVDQRQEYVEHLRQAEKLLHGRAIFDGNIWKVSVMNPYTGMIVDVGFRLPKTASKKMIRQRAAEMIWHENADSLASDVLAARRCNAPLALTQDFQVELLEPNRARPSEGEVAFEMALPVLEHMPLAEIVRVREEEALQFDAFRKALRTAIKDRLATASDETATQLAREIADDVITPALNDISRRLDVAQTALSRKAAIHAVMGSAITTVGLLAGAPLVLTAGIGALGLALPVVDQYFDARKEVEMNDMYFLWRQEERHRR
jgi:hypothetical protein